MVSHAAIFGVSQVETVYQDIGTYASRIIDTGVDFPAYNYISWDWEWEPGFDESSRASKVRIKMRSDSSPDLSEAGDWSLYGYEISESPPSGSNKRYVQFLAELIRSEDQLHTPYLSSVTIRWPGDSRMVDFGGTFGRMSDGGRANVTVNGAELTSGLSMDIQLFGHASGYGGKSKRIISTVTTEFSPRNSIY